VRRMLLCWLCTAVISLTGCNAQQESRRAIIQEEIATLTSVALSSSSLTPAQRDRVIAAGAKIIKQMEDN
jgi:hypothetical protein